MVMWKDGDWLKFIGRSGLQYRYTFSVHLPPEDVYEKTKAFYEGRKCEVIAEAKPTRLELKRGSPLIVRLGYVPGFTETRLKQVVRLEYTGNDEFTEVSINYDAKAHLTICVPPMAFVRETRHLESILKDPCNQPRRFSVRAFVTGLAVGAILSIFAAAISRAFPAETGRRGRHVPSFSSLGDRLMKTRLARNGECDNFGVILNGDDDTRHKDNVSLAYSTLLANGYAPENLFVFSYQDARESSKNGSQVSGVAEPEQPGDGEAGEPVFLTYAPTYENIEMFFEEFVHKTIDENDYLTIYVTGHGTHKGRTGVLAIKKLYEGDQDSDYFSEDLSAAELAAMLSGLETAQTVFVFDQCHSGFADIFPLKNYLAVSRTAVTETGTCRHFAERLFKLLNPETQGRRVSVGEAFETTLRFDEDYRRGMYTPSITGPLKDVADEVFLSK